MSMTARYLLIAVVSYLLGSASVGMILSKAFHGPDLRKVGSGSTGASNVLRTMGTKWGIITLLGDFLKAVLACAFAHWIDGGLYASMLAGFCCILGHNWPIYFEMEGGKGVAASCGVMLMTFPLYGAISIASAIAIIAVTRFISLGSMVMLSIFAVLVSVWGSHGDILVIVWAILLAVICLWRHHGNISRLMKGKERKIGEKEKV